MEVKNFNVFQADSNEVNSVYRENANYLIEYDLNIQNDLCAIYFSSNNIYFPNDENVFNNSIVKKNKYEWYGTRLHRAHKHIFIRDIKKQWYLTGINSTVDSPFSLKALLAEETKGYRICTIGSSAGGYAAVLYGQLLGAEMIYCFNGQFELYSLLDNSTPEIDPIVFRSAANPQLREYYDLKHFIKEPENIYYFFSSKSNLDISQYNHIKECGLNIISFIARNHGIPILKNNLPILLAKSKESLKEYSLKTIHPLPFSIANVGLINTVIGLYNQLIKN